MSFKRHFISHKCYPFARILHNAVCFNSIVELTFVKNTFHMNTHIFSYIKKQTTMKKITILVVLLTMAIHSFAQVNTQILDNMASELVTVNEVNVAGEIHSSYRNSGGVAAISCRGNYCDIFAHPNAMNTKSRNTWAFIIGHEIGHYMLGHTGCGTGGKQKEFDADVVGARLAKNAGYNLSSYINDLERQPNTCSRSHGCWSERINNLRSSFGYRTNRPHGCDNRVTRLAFPWF